MGSEHHREEDKKTVEGKSNVSNSSGDATPNSSRTRRTRLQSKELRKISIAANAKQAPEEPNTLTQRSSDASTKTAEDAAAATDEALRHAKEIAKRGRHQQQLGGAQPPVKKKNPPGRLVGPEPDSLITNNSAATTRWGASNEDVEGAEEAIFHAKSIGRGQRQPEPIVGAHAMRNSQTKVRRTKSSDSTDNKPLKLNFLGRRRHKSNDSTNSGGDREDDEETKKEVEEPDVHNSQQEIFQPFSSSSRGRKIENSRAKDSEENKSSRSGAPGLRNNSSGPAKKRDSGNQSLTSEEFLMNCIRHRSEEPQTSTTGSMGVSNSQHHENEETNVITTTTNTAIPGATAVEGTVGTTAPERTSANMTLTEEQEIDLETPLITAVLVSESDSSDSTFKDEEAGAVEATSPEQQQEEMATGEIVEAKIVRSSDFRNNPKAKLILGMITCLIVAVIVMAVVLVGGGGGSSRGSSSVSNSEPPSLPPNPEPSVVENTTTTAPTPQHSNIFAPHSAPPTISMDAQNQTTAEASAASENNVTVAPTSVPTSAPTAFNISSINWTDSLAMNLPVYSIMSLQDPNSPLSQAYDWLRLHPDIDNMTEWRKHQLYGMATMFYSLNGHAWNGHESRNWLNYSVVECQILCQIWPCFRQI